MRNIETPPGGTNSGADENEHIQLEPGVAVNFDRSRGSRYSGMEADELVAMIDELEGKRFWSRLREWVWVSILFHLALFAFITWGPHYIFRMPEVVNPADVLKDRKDLTYLDLPPDALQKLKPRKDAPISNQDRVAKAKNPTLDKKTLEQLQAMKKAGPPAPKTPQPQQQQQPQPPAPQPAPQPQQQQPSASQPQAPEPPAPQPQHQLDSPRPTPVPARPTFNAGPMNAEDAMRQAARDAARGGGAPDSGDYGANAPSQHPGVAAMGGPDILSDTMGVDFGPYMNKVIRETRQTWEPLIPEVARPPLNKNGTVAIQFIIDPDGRVRPHSMKLVGTSRDVSLDRAAWGAIQGADYPPLPKEFKGPYLELRFYFLYNPKR